MEVKALKKVLKYLKKASIEGVTDIVLTPHYIEDTKYNCNNKK